MKKRVLRLFVALTLCLTLLSTAVFAETGTGVILNSETTTVSVPAQDGDSSNAGTAAAGDDQPSAPESLQEAVTCLPFRDPCRKAAESMYRPAVRQKGAAARTFPARIHGRKSGAIRSGSTGSAAL